MPDDPAVAVEQRPARVARVHRGVDLDEALDRHRAVGQLERPVEAGHDARAHRAVQAERVADDERLACRSARAFGLPSVAGTMLAGGSVGWSTAMSLSAWRATIVAPDVLPSAKVSLIAVDVVDHVEGGEDVAREVHDDPGAQAVLRLAGRVEAVGLDEDERRLDGGIDELRTGRGRRHGRERGRDVLLDVRRGEGSGAGEHRGPQGDRQERGNESADEGHPAPGPRTDPGDPGGPFRGRSGRRRRCVVLIRHEAEVSSGPAGRSRERPDPGREAHRQYRDGG